MELEISHWNSLTKKFTIIFAIVTIISSTMYLLWNINIPGLSSISLSFCMLGLSIRYINLYKINKIKLNLLLSLSLIIVFALTLFVGIDSIQTYIFSI